MKKTKQKAKQNKNKNILIVATRGYCTGSKSDATMADIEVVYTERLPPRCITLQQRIPPKSRKQFTQNTKKNQVYTVSRRVTIFSPDIYDLTHACHSSLYIANSYYTFVLYYL